MAIARHDDFKDFSKQLPSELSECDLSALPMGTCVTVIEDVPQESEVIFLNKWTHLLASLATVTTRSEKPESGYFICSSIRELPGKPPTDAHSAAGLIIVNTVDSYTIPEEFSPKLLAWMTIPMCILKRCHGFTLLQCLTKGSSTTTKVVISMMYAMPGIMKQISSIRMFFRLGKMQAFKSDCNIVNTSDLMIFGGDLPIKTKYPVYCMDDCRRKEEEHFCMIPAKANSVLFEEVTRVLDHSYYSKEHLKAILVLVNLTERLGSFLEKCHQIYSAVKVVVAFVKSDVQIDCALIQSTSTEIEDVKSYVGTVPFVKKKHAEFSHTLRKHGEISNWHEPISQYPWSTKSAVESVSELWTAIREAPQLQRNQLAYNSATKEVLKEVLKETHSRHLPFHLLVLSQETIMGDTKEYGKAIYDAVCSEDVFSLAENLLMFVNAQEDSQIVLNIAKFVENFKFQIGSPNVTEEIFWRILFLFFSKHAGKEKPKPFWAELHKRKVKSVSLSDAKTIAMLQKWTCLQSLLKQDFLPGKKLMKILHSSWKDCTYFNARKLVIELKEKAFRECEPSAIQLLKVLMDREPLGTPSEGLDLLSAIISCSMRQSKSLKEIMKNFSVQLAMKVNFSKPNEAEDFYIKGKALFADEEEKLWIWKGVETSINERLSKYLDKMCNDLARMKVLIEHELGSIVNVTNVDDFLSKLSKDMGKNHFKNIELIFQLCNSVLDRFPHEQKIHEKVCTVMITFVSLNSEMRAGDIIEHLASLSLPQLGVGVDVDKKVEELEQSIRGLVLREKQDVKAVTLFTDFLVSASEIRKLTQFEKCTLQAFCPVHYTTDRACLEKVTKLLKRTLSCTTEDDVYLCQMCWDIVTKECEAHPIDPNSVSKLCCEENVLELTTLFSTIDERDSNRKFNDWKYQFSKAIQNLIVKLKEKRITVAEMTSLEGKWNHIESIAKSLNLPIPECISPASLWKELEVECNGLRNSLFHQPEGDVYVVDLLKKCGVAVPKALSGLQEKLLITVEEVSIVPPSWIFKEEVFISDILSAIVDVCNDLSPLKEHMAFLNYITAHEKCCLFKTYMTQSASPPSSIKDLSESLGEMQRFMKDLAENGVASMSMHLSSIGLNKLTEEVIEKEVTVWRTWHSNLESRLHKVIHSYYCMKASYPQIIHLHAACQQYCLQACLDDDEMSTLITICADWSSERHEFSNDQVLCNWQELQRVLKSENPDYCDYFQAVNDSDEFHKFLVGLNRISSSCFQDLYGLISQHLPYDKSTEDILGSLLEARESMLPFLDVKQSFDEMMDRIVDVHFKYHSLRTVNQHMNQIKQWFRDAEGYTLESVLKEFEVIMDCGEFIIQKGEGNARRELMLRVDCSPIKFLWGESELSNFNRRLGLLEKPDKSDWSFGKLGLKESVKLYQESLQLSRKLLVIINQLEELGKTAELGNILNCCEDRNDAKQAKQICHSKLQHYTENVETWRGNLSSIRMKYGRLLLFMIPKLKRLEEIIAKEHTLQDVGRELVHLCDSPEMIYDNPVASEGMPFEHVGTYLHSLKNLDLPHSISSPTYQHSLHILTDEQGHQGMIQKLLDIYGEIPNPVVVYQCRKDTTEEELVIFFQRAKFFNVPFTVIDVQLLPLRMQEVIIRNHKESMESCTMHYITYGPTKMNDVSGISVTKYALSPNFGEQSEWEDLVKNCRKQLEQRYSVQLVYGSAGCGKTHYIKSELKEKGLPYVVITVDESFSADRAIRKLRSLENYEGPNSIYFNFTLIFPTDTTTELEMQKYQSLCDKLQWFFTNLLFFNYVEDFQSGLSFGFPFRKEWPVFIEVPSIQDSRVDPATFLSALRQTFPVFKIVGGEKHINQHSPFNIFNKEALLVCKYMQAYDQREDFAVGIDKCYRDHLDEKIEFSRMPEVSERECQRLLNKYTPKNVKQNKMTWWYFIRFLARKCRLMELCPSFSEKYFKGPFGSLVFDMFLREAAMLTSENIMNSSVRDLSQLVLFDEEKIGKKFHYIPAVPEEMPKEIQDQCKLADIQIQGIEDVEECDYMERLLASVFDIELTEDKEGKRHLALLNEKNYILTLDFALKMIQINERMYACCPVIIEGETGVGKTFLIEMVACFWNASVLRRWNKVVEKLRSRVKKLHDKHLEMHPLQESSFSGVHKENVPVQMRELFEDLNSEKNLLTKTIDALDRVLRDPTLHLIELQQNCDGGKIGFDFKTASSEYRKAEDKLKYAPDLIEHLLSDATPRIFYKLNVHGALSVEEFEHFFDPINRQADDVQRAWKSSSQCPRIVVFLDEINTSQYPGLMKEIVIDRTFHGEPLPLPLFIIAACNPHRGHSLVTHERKEHMDDWIKGTYYVNKLHPSIQCLIWKYGALDERQEYKYIHEKMSRMNKEAERDDRLAVKALSEKVGESQRALRHFASEHYRLSGYSKEISEEMSKCCVSQRDIQRSFTIFEKLMEMYRMFEKHHISHPCTNESRESSRKRALFVSLGIVYYFRLTLKHRKEYLQYVENIVSEASDLTFEKALEEEMTFYCDAIDCPQGVAKTAPLKENLLCIVLCCCARLPLIIVGEPGCSKTFSFTLAINNFKGSESPQLIFRNTIFCNLWPHYYQCSRRTSSVEVENLFKKAIRRQQRTDKTVENVVFMDEAGLPEESMEALKILHKYLDDPQVSFVGISNHVLDAAKSNRAITLFRQHTDSDDKNLRLLAEGCFGGTFQYMGTICDGYSKLLTRYKNFFGLRDLMHLFSYMRRNISHTTEYIESDEKQLVVNAIERNFGGAKSMQDVVQCIFPEATANRNIVDVLKESLFDHPHFSKSLKSVEGHQPHVEEVRYKIVIDPSEDHSSRRLMLMFDLFKVTKPRTFILGGFPDDGEFQKIDMIADICHAASNGEQVFMLQTDSIHESFYDLFNQHFRIVRGKDKPHFYATVAIGSHSKPCRVDSDFQCIVIIQEEELINTPAPFLNRFEKYRICTESFFEASLSFLPYEIKSAVELARQKVDELVAEVNPMNFCGYDSSTIDSIFLELLPKRKCSTDRIFPIRHHCVDDDLEKGFLIDIFKCLINLNFQLTLDMNQIDTQWAIIEPMMSERTISGFPTETDQRETENKMDNSTSISILVISLVIYINVTQKLLQILTPEALIMSKSRRTIPQWCFDVYLHNQDSFSVHNLLKGSGLQNRSSKLVCFTSSIEASSEVAEAFTANDNSAVCKLSEITTQEELQEKLCNFVNSTQAVFILIADMHTSSKPMINTVRVKIDEIGESSESFILRNKVFLILLYFPPAMSQKSCYPAIFLNGWDFFYLDSLNFEDTYYIASNQWLSLRNLFWYAYKDDVKYTESVKQKMKKSGYSLLLKDAANVLTERVPFSSFKSPGKFNGKHICKTRAKRELLKDILLQSDIGNRLIQIYVDMWDPELVDNHLRGAATYSRGCKAMISITDLVFHQFEKMLQNFLAHMVYHMNVQLNLDTYDDATKELYLNFIDYLPIPRSLRDIDILSSQSVPHVYLNFQHFPNFENVFMFFDSTLTDASDLPEREHSRSVSGSAAKWREAVENSKNKSMLTALRFIRDHDDMLQRYMKDFGMYKLLLPDDSDIAVLEDLLQSTGAETPMEKLFTLHSLLQFSPVGMRDFWSIIGYLKNEVLSAPLQSDAILTCLMKGRHESASYLAELLYEGLRNCHASKENLQKWQNACYQLCCSSDMYNLVMQSKHRGLPVWIAVFIFIQSIDGQQHTEMYEVMKTLCEHLIGKADAATTSLTMEEVLVILQSQKIDPVMHAVFMRNIFGQYFNSMLFDMEDKPHLSWFAKFLDDKHFPEEHSTCATTYNGYLFVHMLQGNESVMKLIIQADNTMLASCPVTEYSPPFYPTAGNTTLLADMYFLTHLQRMREQFKMGEKHDRIAHILNNICALEDLRASQSLIQRIDREVFIQLLLHEVAYLLSDESESFKLDSDITAKINDVLSETVQHRFVLEALLSEHDQNSPVKKRAAKKGFINFQSNGQSTCDEYQLVRIHTSYPVDWTNPDIKSTIKLMTPTVPAQFMMDLLDQARNLYLGLELLPHLMELGAILKKYLYQHYDRSSAMEVSLNNAIEATIESMPSEKEKKDLKTLYHMFTEKYVAFHSGSNLSRDVPLRNVIAVASSSKVVTDVESIVHVYSQMMVRVEETVKFLNLVNWTPRKDFVVKLSTFSTTTLLLRRPLEKNHLLMVLRQSLPLMGKSIDESNLNQMCCDVIATFFAGMPEIDIDIPLPELFKLQCQSTGDSNSMLREFEALSQDLSSEVFEYKRDMQLTKEDCVKQIYIHFHTCDYHSCITIVKGLQRITRHICQKRNLDPLITLRQFMTDISDKTPGRDDSAVFEEIFPHLQRSLAPALRALGRIRIGNILHILEIFSSWIDDGFYIFRSLPLGVKRTLPGECISQLKQASQEVSVVQDLIPLEDSIPVEVMGFAFGDIETLAFEQPLQKYIVENRILSKEDPLLVHIPSGVLVHHYVSFILVLRNITKEERLKVKVNINKEEAVKMTEYDVICWLKKQGLASYCDMFRTEHVDGALLIELEVDDLPYLGIKDPAHQDIILEWITAVKGEEQHVPVWRCRKASKTFRKMGNKDLRKWLGKIDMAAYDRMFKEAKVKGRYLAGIEDYRELAANSKTVKSESESSDSEEEPELNITNSVHAKRLLVKFYEDQDDTDVS